MAALRESLSKVLVQSAISIPIQAKKFGISVALVNDRTLYTTSVFILAARADLAAEEVRRRFPAQLKIGPVEKIGDLVRLALPGVPVHAVPVAPRQIPYPRGLRLFRAGSNRPAVGRAQNSGGVAMHVAGEFPGPGARVLGDPELTRNRRMPNSDDPFFRPDATRMRPRPGGGRRTHIDAPRPQAPAPSAPIDDELLSQAARGLLGVGLNPLVQAASPLLLLTAQVRDNLSPADVESLRRHALEEIRRFEEQARSSGVAERGRARRAVPLCAGLDEAVLSTPWGNQSEWAQHPLLVTLHRETWGGEKFFEMLDRISQDPAALHRPDGAPVPRPRLWVRRQVPGAGARAGAPAEIQQDLYRKIREQRGSTESELSLRWRGLEDRRNPLIRSLPWWIVAAAALPILALTFTAYRSILARIAAPVHAELAKVGLEDFAPSRAVAPVVGPTLKQLLAPDEQRGVLSVEEDGNRTTVTLLARDLFPSGSAAVNPAYHEALGRLTAALNKVPGRVLVEGHTDDQPIKSLRYQDNFELSRERAVSVVTLLQQGIDNRGRLQWSGKGSSEPDTVPSPFPRTDRGIVEWRSSMSAEPDARRAGDPATATRQPHGV